MTVIPVIRGLHDLPTSPLGLKSGASSQSWHLAKVHSCPGSPAPAVCPGEGYSLSQPQVLRSAE